MVPLVIHAGGNLLCNTNNSRRQVDAVFVEEMLVAAGGLLPYTVVAILKLSSESNQIVSSVQLGFNLFNLDDFDSENTFVRAESDDIPHPQFHQNGALLQSRLSHNPFFPFSVRTAFR